MKTLADQQTVAKLTDALAQSIRKHVVEPAHDRPWALVGIRSRGDVLARRLAQQLKPDYLGTLDITLYRDDLSEIGSHATVRTTEVDFSIDGLDVVLVDDVLMTGRSVRAALQSLIDFGRPRRVWLAVLVDRGGRELPIAPDFVGLDLSRDQLPRLQRVEVRLTPGDAEDAVLLREAQAEGAAE